MHTLEGRVAVVTGAGSGIGLACAQRFANEGMKVVLADIQEDALEAAVSGLKAAGHDVLGVPTDVSKYEQVQSLAEQTLSAFGAVHLLHNNAGVLRAGRMEELSLEDWQWVIGVNLWSVIYGTRVFLPLIRQAGEGHIINTASTAGLQATDGIGPYNVSKFGVVGFTETLRLELDGSDPEIGASVLCPGSVRTQICDSERNRQATGLAAGELSPTGQAFKELAGAVIEAGIEPSDVADMVVAAVLKNNFWIVTHPDWKAVIRERTDGLMNDQLVTGFGG